MNDKSEYIRTNDVMTAIQIREFLDYDDDTPGPGETLPDVIPVCSGEWRKEPDGQSWRAWDHPKD